MGSGGDYHPRMEASDPAGEQVFRWLFVAVLAAAFGLSAFYRHRARKIGGTIARRREGAPAMAARAVIALPLFGSFLVYAIAPRWMAWSALPLPAWARWLGAGLGIACIPLLAWVLRSIGSNISEEAHLEQAFGDQYRAYRRRTGALLPRFRPDR